MGLFAKKKLEMWALTDGPPTMGHVVHVIGHGACAGCELEW